MRRTLAALAITVSLTLTSMIPVFANVKNYIAHAGGSIYGQAYTNSLEALNLAYANGYHQIEVDVIRSAEGELILAHDTTWITDLLIGKIGNITLHDFKNTPARYGLTLMTFHELTVWMQQNRMVYIVLDKLEFADYAEIAEKYPALVWRFVPQATQFDDYAKLKAIGYNKVIMTLYKTWYTEDQIVRFASQNYLWGLTMAYERFSTFSKKAELTRITQVYVHTINEKAVVDELANQGVAGVYTDTILPDGTTAAQGVPTAE